MFPSAHVVASPDGTKPLRARKEGTGEDEGTTRWIFSLDEGLGCQIMLPARLSISMRDTLSMVIADFTCTDDLLT